MKKLLLLSDINSPHTQKWATALVDNGFKIAVFSLSKATTVWFKDLINFELFDEHGFEKSSFYKSTFQKIAFVKVMPSLKKAIKTFQPDIVHAHYASSYGLIGALCKFHPFLISVWGSDVFDFPKQNFINKKVLEFNLRKADLILSTSIAMQVETNLYTDKQIQLIPFGIDTSVFKPIENAAHENIVIGTIKRLEEIYGISYLIKAFSVLNKKYDNLHLLLVGDGKQTDEYKRMVSDLGMSGKVTFTGLIPHNEVVAYHNKLDVYVAVSLRESFGVAVLEASACAKPVVVSNVGGLPEVVIPNKTGFIVPCADVNATASAIEILIKDKALRKEIGVNGREFVISKYEWKDNLNQLITIYNQF